MRRVVVSGVGVVTCVGQTVPAFLEALAASRSGIRRVPAEVYPGAGAPAAGLVDFVPNGRWTAAQLGQLDRASQFGIIATEQALGDAALALTDEELLAAGVYWGTGMGGANSLEEAYREHYVGRGRARPSTVVLCMNNAPAGQISMANGFRGPILNFSTACSSSASAIGEAYRAIRDGYADVIVAGGSEALLTHGILKAWQATSAVARVDESDPSRSCKPFSANRTGLVLAEGAAALVLESEERATRRGARIYAELAGYGNAADAASMSKPDANGQVRAMRAALADARVAPDAVQYVNAHGTATPVGDTVETSAIKEVFGEHARRLAISSTKALHGHLMGATGAVELVASIGAIVHGMVPPTAHLEQADPSCDLDYVAEGARQMPVRVALSNSFGFGGMNAVLVVRAYDGGRSARSA